MRITSSLHYIPYHLLSLENYINNPARLKIVLKKWRKEAEVSKR